MIANKAIVVGSGITDDMIATVDVVRAQSCQDLRLLLSREARVHLLCTDMKLPDGSWCDVLRLLVASGVSAEVRVFGDDGHAILRLEVNPRHCLVQTLDASQNESLARASSLNGSEQRASEFVRSV